MDLGFVSEERGNWFVLGVSGEIDVATAPRLRERFIDTVNGGHANVVLDLREVGFLDSTGLGVIVGCLKRARANGGDICVVCDRDAILRNFEITGLTSIFEVYRDVDDAPS